MSNCSSRKRWLQTRVKKNLFTDLLVTDVVQEIETLLGRQVREDLDLEALELAVRQQVLQLAGCAVEQRLNADTGDERLANSLRLWAGSPLCRSSGQTGAKCTRPVTTRARLLSLLLLRPGLLPSGPASGHRKDLPLSSPHAHGGYRGCFGQLPGRQRAVDGTGRREGGCQAGGENRRSPGRRNRRRRAPSHRA